MSSQGPKSLQGEGLIPRVKFFSACLAALEQDPPWQMPTSLAFTQEYLHVDILTIAYASGGNSVEVYKLLKSDQVSKGKNAALGKTRNISLFFCHSQNSL